MTESADHTPQNGSAADPPPTDQPLTLDQLSQAYAEVLQRDTSPVPPAAPDLTAENETDAEDVDELADEPDADQADVAPDSLLEAILFVGTEDNRPLGSREIAAQIRGVSPREVDELVVELNSRYTAESRPYVIQSEGAGYRMALRDEFARVRERFYGRIREARLSQAAIDILAMVAYNQSITRDELDQLRGKPCTGILSQLVRRQLLSIERSDEKPRTAHYFTTQRFLDLFHLTSLDDLPQGQEDRIL